MKLEQVYDANLNPQYKIGDIVYVNAPEDHLAWGDSKTVLSRIKIERIYPLNPLQTYWGMQLDRLWSEAFPPRKIIYQKDKGHIGCIFNDKLVETNTLKIADYEKNFG